MNKEIIVAAPALATRNLHVMAFPPESPRRRLVEAAAMLDALAYMKAARAHKVPTAEPPRIQMRTDRRRTIQMTEATELIRAVT